MDHFSFEHSKYEWHTWEYNSSLGITSLKRLTENAISNVYGVYLIKAPVKLNRLNGSSDVVYIGQSGAREGKQGIRGRLFNTRGFEEKIREKIESLYPNQQFKLECSFTSTYSYSPKIVEENLLKAYLMTHFELPPANHQGLKNFTFDS